MPESTAQLVVSDWEEAPVEALASGTAVAHATSLSEFSGAWAGTGKASWSLVYTADGSASFVGVQSFSGVLDGREGSFVLQLSGTFEEGTAKVDWEVMPGTGTGQLAGLRGRGGYASAADAEHAIARLDYELS